jgi:hypothetical protein
MTSNDNNTQESSITLETATNWARSNREWEKVYRYLFVHPQDFFVISPGRRWPIAHQVIYHGDVELFKRILALFSDDQINIHSKSGDDKTLLDVALEKRQAHPAMYTYVEHLFAQDGLMEEAKNSNWRSVSDILEKNKLLQNEKPPYSPYFLLHYIVQNGDAEILKSLLDRFQFLTNVLNRQKETPLDMAMRLNKYDMCSILRPITTTPRSNFSHSEPQSPQYSCRNDERATDHGPIRPPTEPVKYQTQSSEPNPPPRAYVPTAQRPSIGFGNVVLDISENGDFTVGPQVLYNSTRDRPPPPRPPPKPQPQPQPQPQQQQQQQQPPRTGFQHVHTKKTIIKECPLTNLDPPPPPPAPKTTSTSSNEQVMKNLTCSLTHKIFVDPVIATDGQTYERAAILEWINLYDCSPTTGAKMDKTFRDNTEIKNIIQSMQRQS